MGGRRRPQHARRLARLAPRARPPARRPVAVRDRRRPGRRRPGSATRRGPSFAQGVSRQTPLSVGEATIAVSFVLLAIWIPLRVRPGLGTLLNALLIGVALDATLALVGPAPLGRARGRARGGIALVGVGSGLYLGAALGPGPRDGLMMGLHHRTGRPVALLRGAIEVTALTAGAIARREGRHRHAGVRAARGAGRRRPGCECCGPGVRPLPRGPAACCAGPRGRTTRLGR